VLPEFASIALTLQQKIQGSDEAIVYIGNLKKILIYSCTTFVAMSSYIIVFAFAYVLENLALLYGNFGKNSYRVAGDEARR
jgi:hypothetical protein